MNQNIPYLVDILYYSHMLSKEASDDRTASFMLQNANIAAAFLIMSGYPYKRDEEDLCLSAFNRTFKISSAYLKNIYGADNYNALLSRSSKEIPVPAGHAFPDISQAVSSGDYDSAIQKVLSYADETFINFKKGIEDSDVSSTLWSLSQKIDTGRVLENDDLRMLKERYQDLRKSFDACQSALESMRSAWQDLYSMISVISERSMYTRAQFKDMEEKNNSLRRENMVLYSRLQQAQALADSMKIQLLGSVSQLPVPVYSSDPLPADEVTASGTGPDAMAHSGSLQEPSHTGTDDTYAGPAGNKEPSSAPAGKRIGKGAYYNKEDSHSENADIDLDDIEVYPVSSGPGRKEGPSRELSENGPLFPAPAPGIHSMSRVPIARASFAQEDLRLCWKQFDLKLPGEEREAASMFVEFIFCPCFGEPKDHLVMIGLIRKAAEDEPEEHVTTVRHITITERLAGGRGHRISIPSGRLISEDLAFFVGTSDAEMEYSVQLPTQITNKGYDLIEKDSFSCSGTLPGHLVLDTDSYRAEIVPVLLENNAGGFADVIYEILLKGDDEGTYLPISVTGATDDKDGISFKQGGTEHLIITRWDGPVLLAEQIQ